MQNYYLQHECLSALAPRHLQPFRMDEEGQFVIGTRNSHLQIYRLLDHDLTFHSRHSFHAKIERIQVLPSQLHRHDYVWVLDAKGRFCCWHPVRTEQVSNAVLWEQREDLDGQSLVFSGANWQFEERSTVGTIFYTWGHIFVLLHFRINEKGVSIDHSNIIKYPLPAFKVRFVEWVKHSSSLFLVGFIVEEEGKTTLCVFDLEKGAGVCAESMEWRFEKTNLLQFYSCVAGELLVVTYNQVSLHNYKSSSALRNYRTRGNYGQGFYLGDGFYGHLGEELIVFSRDHLTTYGQVKASNASVSFSSLCLTHCSILGEVNNGTAIALQTYEGDVYLLRLFQKIFTVSRLFTTLGPILELCSLKSGKLFAVVSQQADYFQVSLLQRQTQIEIKEQMRLDQEEAQKIMMISGGIFIIVCSQNSNNVYRFNRYQKYEFYFQLPGGNILTAEGNFIVYDCAIFQIDYQCFAVSLMVERPILLAQATKQVIYFLDYDGNLSAFQNEKDEPNVLITNRQNDYCWGLFERQNTLLTANLLEPKQVRVISMDELRELSIKGHTLVTSLTSISYRKSRFETDERILVGYADGQIHMHSLHHGQYLHSIHAFDHFGSAPVSFCSCGEDTVLANYTNKQYLISASQGSYQFTNVSLSHSNNYGNLYGYIQKSGDLCIICNSTSQGILLQRLSLNSMKESVKVQSGKTFSIKKLQEWFQSVPLLLRLDDRIIIAGCRLIHLIKLQSYKVIRSFHHNLKEIITLGQIKMGIILCGVDFQSLEHVIILNEQLEQVCRFQLHTKTPVRCLKTVEDQNQFYLAYDDALTLYRITANMQMQAVVGKKIQLEAYHVDICDELLLINDPFKCLAVLEHKESINGLGTYMPAYKIQYSLFMGEDMLYIDERGFITLLSARMDNVIDNYYKFTKVFSVNLGSPISAIYREEQSVYYATREGKIGVLKQISRDGFDALKKVQTETLLQMDLNPRFSYWQWRDRPPAHERIIDGQMFPDNQILGQHFLA